MRLAVVVVTGPINQPDHDLTIDLTIDVNIQVEFQIKTNPNFQIAFAVVMIRAVLVIFAELGVSWGVLFAVPSFRVIVVLVGARKLY